MSRPLAASIAGLVSARGRARGAFALAAALAAMRPAAGAAPNPAFPGQITLRADLRDAARKIYRVRETVPVQPGPMSFFYPKWIPGEHGPVGPLLDFAGLEVSGGGRDLDWSRDPGDPFKFLVAVPAGVSELRLEFEFLAPRSSPVVAELEWNTVVLYPAGYEAAKISVQPAVVLPEGWQFGTALDEAEKSADGAIPFRPVTLSTLVDSPLLAGANFRRIELGSLDGAPLRADVVADKPAQLAAPKAAVDAIRQLVRQEGLLFGSRHFDHYDFLLSLSDELPGEGLEHHQSSEDGAGGKCFLDWGKNPLDGDLLAHEFTHSWNGKFRRPADLWIPNYNVPMGTSLLWVYEGLTQYWGHVMAARSGMVTKDQALDLFASTAAGENGQPGRLWRPVQDTTSDPIAVQRRGIPWRSWQREEDYYNEGALIWLDADTLIRERSHGAKSLDDFARAFFGVRNGQIEVLTYDFDELVSALNAVTPNDWRTFLRSRLDRRGPGAPLDGIARGGYKLVFSETPGDLVKSQESLKKSASFMYSVGFSLDHDAKLTEVLWDGPAFRAGLAPGTQIVAVNGTAFDLDDFKEAVKATSAAGAKPLELLVRTGNRFRTVTVDYRGGLRYPKLERLPGVAAPLLDAILAPRSQ